ncbi:hypothetical protein VTO73DRAFT_11716 [Trametes versicolor]
MSVPRRAALHGPRDASQRCADGRADAFMPPCPATRSPHYYSASNRRDNRWSSDPGRPRTLVSGPAMVLAARGAPRSLVRCCARRTARLSHHDCGPSLPYLDFDRGARLRLVVQILLRGAS